jgi:chemotaxis protein MotB
VFETSNGGGSSSPVAPFFGEVGILDAQRGILSQSSAIEGLKDQIEAALRNLPEFPEIKDQIIMQVTAEGLLIELVDKDNKEKSFFDLSSAELKPTLRHILEKIVQQISQLPHKIAIGGHTDARPFRNNSFYSNWELSASRALNTRRVMEESGLPAGHVERVVGYADSTPLVIADPQNPANRRISLLILKLPDAAPIAAPVPVQVTKEIPIPEADLENAL